MPQVLDTRRGVETPEGVMFDLRPAGPVVRFAALFIDIGIRWTTYLVLAGILAPAGNLGAAAMLIGMFLTEWFYPVVFEVLFGGATPGKRAMGIMVVEDSGLPVSIGASITRNLLIVADFLPFMYAFGVTSMLLTREFKRLGDLAAGTQVVYRESERKARPLPEAAPVAPRLLPALEVQQAVIALAERSTRLTAERVDELTELAERAADLRPVTHPRERLFGVAQWLMGKR